MHVIHLGIKYHKWLNQKFVPVIYVSEKRSHVYLVVDAMERFAEEHDVALTAMREAWVRVDTIYVTMDAAGKI